MYSELDRKHRQIIQELNPGCRKPIAEEKIYLMEYLGTELGHGYFWHDKQHVASSDLTDYLTENRKYWQTQLLDPYPLSDEDKANIARLQELLSKCPADMSEFKYLDLCSSLVFLAYECRHYHAGCYGIKAAIDQAYSPEQQGMVFDLLVETGFLLKKNKGIIQEL